MNDPNGRRAPAAMRLTVDVATFAAWRRVVPGLAVPEDFDVTGPAAGVDPPNPAAPPIPAFVAASFAVHAGAEVTVRVRVHDPSARVVVCLSVAGDLAAVLVRATRSQSPPGGGDGWVQVGLLPIADAAAEVAAWVPDAAGLAVCTPAPGAGVPGALGAGAQPAGASVQVEVAAADDAVSREVAGWELRDGAWRRLVPGNAGVLDDEPVGPADLVQSLAAVLTDVLTDRLTDVLTDPLRRRR